MEQIRVTGTKEHIIAQAKKKLSSFPIDKKLEAIIRDPKRTNLQNKAIHLFFNFVAQALNDKNMYISKDLLKEGYEMAWNQNTVKELIWRPVQKSITGKGSSTNITTKQCTEIADAIQDALAVKGVVVTFPSIEGLQDGIEPYQIN